MERAGDFFVAADQRIDFAESREPGEVLTKGGQHVLLLRLRPLFVVVVGIDRAPALAVLAGRGFGDAVRKVGNQIEPRDAFLLQNLEGVTVEYLEHGDQHFRSGEFLLAGAFDMPLSAGEHPLESERDPRLGMGLHLDGGNLFVQETVQLLLQPLDVAADTAKNLDGLFVEHQGIKQVFEGDVFVAQAVGFGEGHRETDLKIFRDPQGAAHGCPPPRRVFLRRCAGDGRFFAARGYRAERLAEWLTEKRLTRSAAWRYLRGITRPLIGRVAILAFGIVGTLFFSRHVIPSPS